MKSTVAKGRLKIFSGRLEENKLSLTNESGATWEFTFYPMDEDE
jgi:hypothetical protein